jgi:uncharacterized protein
MIIEIIAYILALFVGITLGLVGAGGSILTLPILVKVAGIEPKQATTYSLFIVGFTAMIGAYNYYRKGSLHLFTAFVFLVPSAIVVFFIRRFFIPALPETLYEFDTFELTTNKAIYILLSIVMIFAAINMLKKTSENLENQDIKNINFNYKLIFFQGIIIGTLTGLVGAGAGFLIVPSLVKFAKLPIRLTIGTSLLIITFNSFLGFGIDLVKIKFDIDWSFLLIFSGIAGTGIFIGMYISNFINAKQLKVVFGIFVLIMAFYNIIKEIFGVIIL